MTHPVHLTKGFLVLAACWGLLLAPAPTAHAEDPVPTALDASQAVDYIGAWVLSIDFQGSEIEIILRVVDIDGKLGATLDSQQQPEPQAVEDIVKTDGGLTFKYQMSMQGLSFEMDIRTKLEGDTLTGTIDETSSGLFSAPLKGRRASEESIELVQGKRPSPTEAKLRIGDEQVRITFGNIPVDSEDHKRFLETKEGEIFTYESSRATKLATDLDLQFGGTLIETENAAPNYPGVYSLWLRRVQDGWRLVFNEQPDIWGTRHDPSADVAEIPLQTRQTGETSAAFLIKLEENDQGGLLRIAWGDTEWSAPFTIPQ